ncbi:steroid 5 alpha-reductase [Cadophora sp. DSE1049]|nr:steroid 5 alpha-reductase [Cadophora sp. DSE1049]
MAIVQNWMPPSKENYELIVYLFQFFPLVTIFQWVQPWYGAGKTSTNSRFNIPGKIAWLTMETPGLLSLLYVMNTLPAQVGMTEIPWENKVMAGLYTIHYLYRAILCPLIAPSMSPIHPLIWLLALSFQTTNGLSIGSWLGGHGPTSRLDWQSYGNTYKAGGRIEFGMFLWAFGLMGNAFHDDELREIRRAALRNQEAALKECEQSTGKGKAAKKGVDKVYMIPENGLFRWIFYPHYLCEWIEWTGFWIVGGWDCVPARSFLLNEIAAMLPRAMQGKKWYEERFGKEKTAGRKAIIPGIL